MVLEKENNALESWWKTQLDFDSACVLGTCLAPDATPLFQKQNTRQTWPSPPERLGRTVHSCCR